MHREAHILVVDDCPDHREFISEALEERGFKVTTAENASQAESLAAAAPHGFRALVTDYHMHPGPNGAELIRVLYQKNAAIEMYILTSSDPFIEKHAKKILSTVVNTPLHLLEKPYRFDLLLQLVEV